MRVQHNAFNGCQILSPPDFSQSEGDALRTIFRVMDGAEMPEMTPEVLRRFSEFLRKLDLQARWYAEQQIRSVELRNAELEAEIGMLRGLIQRVEHLCSEEAIRSRGRIREE